MQIIIHSLTTKEKILINVLDHPIIEKWFNHCYNLQQLTPIKGGMPIHSIGIRSRVYFDIDRKYQDLLRSINTLRNLKIEDKLKWSKFPVIPDVFNRDQHWCNQIHNVFVETQLFLAENINNKELSNNWKSEVDASSKDINFLIHTLENASNLTETEKHCLENFPHKFLSTNIDFGNNRKLHYGFTKEEINEVSEHLGETHHAVSFANYILGKTYLVSYLQEEDPSYPSVSEINGTWANLDIKLDNYRSSIYNSDHFKQWLINKQIAPEELNLEFPVGDLDPSNNIERFIATNAGSSIQFEFKK